MALKVMIRGKAAIIARGAPAQAFHPSFSFRHGAVPTLEKRSVAGRPRRRRSRVEMASEGEADGEMDGVHVVRGKALTRIVGRIEPDRSHRSDIAQATAHRLARR